MISWVFIRDNLSLILYGVALALSIFRYRKYFDTILKYFPILIGYTLLTEILGMLILRNEEFVIVFSEGDGYLNALIYNLFDLCFYSYFFFVYSRILPEAKHKKWIKTGVLSFLVISLINPFFQNFRLSPQIYAIVVGSFFLVSSALIYLKQLNYSKSNHYKNLLFWISLGLLVFYPFYPIIFIIVIYFDDSIYHSLHINEIHQTLLCLMYICFIIGFLKMRRMKPIEKEK